MAIETTAATNPVTNATAPITTALAASTAPRRGVAASVVRMRLGAEEHRRHGRIYFEITTPFDMPHHWWGPSPSGPGARR
jgi:hypothetical protein